MTRVIAITNHKGGCAKTTTAINLAAGLARLDRKVLLIDMDPQAHATIGFNLKPSELEKNVYTILTDRETSVEEVIKPISVNLDIVPSDIVLSGAELELAGAIGRENVLTRAITAVLPKYKYILIDCPPSLGLLTFNSLIACSEVIIPIETGFFALHGVSKLLEVLDIIHDKLNHVVKYHVLATIYDRRTNISQEVLEELKKFFQDKTLKTVIRTNVKLKECVSKGVSIFDYAETSTGAEDYASLSQEIISQEQQEGN